MRRRALPLATSVILAACATAPPPPGPEPSPPSGDPFVWTYGQGGRDLAWLRYGQPASDNVGLALSCPRSATTVHFETGTAGRKAELRLRSDSGERRYPAELKRSRLDGGVLATGAIALTDPVLASFEATGHIAQVEDRPYPQNAETAAERIDIRRFFAFCRGR
jgi:choline dehydrogenase-like flavoprotein